MVSNLPDLIHQICLEHFYEELDLRTFKLCESSIEIYFKYITVYCNIKKKDLIIIYDTDYLSFHIDNFVACGFREDIHHLINKSIHS